MGGPQDQGADTQQQGQQGQGQGSGVDRTRARETRATALRRSAVEDRLKGVNSLAGKSGSFGHGTFGSRPLNTSGSMARSASNVKERPISASVTPPPPLVS